MSTNSGYLDPDLLGSTYLYSDSDEANATFCFVAALTMAVDKSLLERAVNDMMPRFPQFNLRVEARDGILSFSERDTPVRVMHIRDRAGYSESGVFGHDCLFAVFVHHKTVYFDFHRSLTDEKGVVPFVRAVLFHYLELAGYGVENDGSIITADSEYHDIEADDAFSRLGDIPASRPVWYMDARAAVFGNGRARGDYKVTQLHLPFQKLRGEARQYASMPSTIVSPFFSQALLDEHPELDVAGEYIVSYIQVNLRQYFPTTTFRPFFVNLPLTYNRKITEYPVPTVLMSQKKFLEAQLKTDALAYNAQRKMSALENIMETGSIKEKEEAVRTMIRKKSGEFTFSLCNIGNVIMPESMLQYITEFYPVVPPSLFPFSISTINFKGDLVITVTSSAGDRTCDRFAALLKRYDMPAYVTETYIHCPMKYKPEL